MNDRSGVAPLAGPAFGGQALYAAPTLNRDRGVGAGDRPFGRTVRGRAGIACVARRRRNRERDGASPEGRG